MLIVSVLMELLDLLPINATDLTVAECRNLARNNFSGNLPYSISTMFSLTYLSVTSLDCYEILFTNVELCQCMILTFLVLGM